MKIVWTDIITFGTTSYTIATGPKSGIMIIEVSRWCEACNRVCSRAGYAKIIEGPLGELALEPQYGKLPDMIP